MFSVCTEWCVLEFPCGQTIPFNFQFGPHRAPTKSFLFGRHNFSFPCISFLFPLFFSSFNSTSEKKTEKHIELFLFYFDKKKNNAVQSAVFSFFLFGFQMTFFLMPVCVFVPLVSFPLPMDTARNSSLTHTLEVCTGVNSVIVRGTHECRNAYDSYHRFAHECAHAHGPGVNSCRSLSRRHTHTNTRARTRGDMISQDVLLNMGNKTQFIGMKRCGFFHCVCVRVCHLV